MSLSTNMISGLSSGFDWRSMIDQLIAIEHRHVDLVENTKTEYETKLEAWQSFNTKLLALDTAARSLKDSADFHVYTAGMTTDSATVYGEDLLSVTASTSASKGTYTMVVTNLAAAQKLASNPFTSQAEALGSSYAGDIIINGETITIGATDSLADVAISINNANTGSDPIGVAATIINYGTNDYRLILTSDTTGADGISLLNGGATNLTQKFGWKDLAADANETLKNSITNGAQSDRFTSPDTAVYSLLGLSGSRSASDIQIDATAVTIDLSKSLTQIKDDINSAVSTVTASVISETVDGTTYYRLQIEGDAGFGSAADHLVDSGNILNTLGILDYSMTDVSGKVSANAITANGVYMTPDTLLTNIDGYNTFTPGGQAAGGDYITLTGSDTSGADIGTKYFDISTSTTVRDLLDNIESEYGDVIAYMTSEGNIRVDDLKGDGSLTVSLSATIQDTDSSLDFGGFSDTDAGSARKKEIVSGENATITIDGIQVTQSSNTIDDVITGVTLNLVKEDDDTTVTLAIAHDTDTIKSNIEDFIAKYNEVMSYINTHFEYNEEEETTGGVLFGDGTLSSVKSDLTSLLTETIWGVDSNFSILAQVGITMDNDLLLSINSSKLNGNIGSYFNDVMSLFAGQGSTNKSQLGYIGYSRDTQAGQYDVVITKAAAQGTETGNVDLSGGIAATETIKITQGLNTATITLSAGTSLNDIQNAINSELDTEYAQTLAASEQLYSDATQTNPITAPTPWNSIYDGVGAQVTFSNNDIISFEGTSRRGASVSGTYTIGDTATDTVQGLLSAIESAFSSEVTATINTSGRIVLTDKYVGNSQLSINNIKRVADSNEFFGTTISTDNTGGQTGRYAMSITATDDGSNHLVLRGDDYGSKNFTISQVAGSDAAAGNEVILGSAANQTLGASPITAATTWANIDTTGGPGNDMVNGAVISFAGTDHDGNAVSGSYTVGDTSTDTVNGLLTAIETSFGLTAGGTTVDANGKIQITDDSSAGASQIAVTFSCDANCGSLDLGTFASVNTGLANGAVTGQDVEGTIDGEAATGSGQLLTGDDGNVNTAGLSVKYSGTADSFTGNVTLTLGVAELFYRSLHTISDPIDGYVTFKQESLQNNIDSYETKIAQMEVRLDQKMQMMIDQFVRMEMALSRIQSQSNWLTGQIKAASSAWG